MSIRPNRVKRALALLGDALRWATAHNKPRRATKLRKGRHKLRSLFPVGFPTAPPVKVVPLDPYARTTHDGKTVDYLTDAALREVEKRLGYPLTIIQGSYNAGAVGASAGTHDGGGAVDLAPFDWQHKVHAMRAVGFAAWHRPELPGVWNEHIHCILISDERASASAKAQVVDYRNHRDGLAGHAADDTWHPDPIPVFALPADYRP
jgi:hypothetical protein